MIEIIPTAFQIAEATKKFQFGKLKNSIRKGEGNMIGALGEILTHDYFKSKNIQVEYTNTYDHDLKINGISNFSYTLDVKTKECTSTPLDHYNASVSDANTTQDCDFYLFVRIMKDHSRAWLLGFLLKEDFYSMATFNKKGTADPNDFTGWPFKADCYNLQIKKLKSIKL